MKLALNFVLRRGLFLFLIINLAAVALVFAQTELRENEQVARRIKAKETHEYSFRGVAGKCLHLVVMQEDVDVVVSLFDSQNVELAKIDRSNTTHGPEKVTFILPAADIYRIKIEPQGYISEKSLYTIELLPFTVPTELDTKRSDAEKTVSQAAFTSLENTGAAHRKAVSLFLEALEIWQELGDQYEESVSRYGLGWEYLYLSEFENAALQFESGAAIAAGLHEQFMTAHNVRGAGQAFLNLGEFELAEYKFDKALEIYRAINQPRFVGFTLYSGGTVKRILRRYAEANVMLDQSLQFRRQIKDWRGMVLTLTELARVSQNQNDYETALGYLNEALEITKTTQVKGEVEVLAVLGWVYLRKSAYAPAEELLQKVLTVQRQEENLAGEAETLNTLAMVYAGKDEREKAAAYFEASIKAIEKLRERTRNQRFRTSFIEQTQLYYVNYIRFLMSLHARFPTQGFDRQALYISEKSRARGLLELVGKTNAVPAGNIPPVLVSENVRIRALYISRLKDLRRSADKTAQAKISDEISDILREKFAVENKINALAVPATAPPEITPLKTPEIQALLDDETVLLEFGLYGQGEKELTTQPGYLWAVTKSATAGVALPPRPVIEAKVRALYELLTRKNQGEKSSPPINNEAEIEKKAAELAEILLKPVAQNTTILTGKKRLLIVANGALQALPFALLPFPASTGAKPEMLLEKFEIVNLPSASVLKILRENEKSRQTGALTAAVIADPVFSANDERFAGAPVAVKTVKSAQAPQIVRFGDYFGRENLPRLFNTRLEAAAISSHLPAAKKLVWLDFAADQQTFLATDWANFRILHFATHALIDDEQPELSGLVLSLVDKNKNPLDGILLAGDISALRLRADLVVLSGCRTALGKPLKGEGYVGLTQNFMQAGASRVMSSLWAVEDRATAQLMANFYQHLLGKTPHRTAAALRLAQLEMAKDPRWKNPYYWGAFIVQGDF